jgi:hypothetical protein
MNVKIIYGTDREQDRDHIYVLPELRERRNERLR